MVVWLCASLPEIACLTSFVACFFTFHLPACLLAHPPACLLPCMPAPSIRRIQQVLVELGDKEPSFVGSSRWIGAIELSYVLDQLLGVRSVI